MKNKALIMTETSKDYEQCLADFNWTSTEMGTLPHWSDTMKMLSNTCFLSNTPMALLWGENFTQIYNDAYRNIIGTNYSSLYGALAKDIWKNYWLDLAPLLQKV